MTAVTTTRELELAEALSAVRSRLAHAAEAAGRNVDEIELLPITKFFPATDVVILTRLGCAAFGESREQEASNKADEVSTMLGAEPIRWHMVGRIQRNKARSIAGWAYAAHSVDSAKVIAVLDRAAARALAEGRRAEPLRIYIQISLDGDENGAALTSAGRMGRRAVCSRAGRRGLGVHWADGAFRRRNRTPRRRSRDWQAERERVQRDYPQPLGLSAGMSSDLEIAVEHGSTCVRVGTALLGQRPLTSP